MSITITTFPLTAAKVFVAPAPVAQNNAAPATAAHSDAVQIKLTDGGLALAGRCVR